MTVAHPRTEFLDMHSYCFIWDVFSNLAIKTYFKIDFHKGANAQEWKAEVSGNHKLKLSTFHWCHIFLQMTFLKVI